jgi:23S rRNA-/tRNA-specific pseudouridylate synthase
MKDNKTPIVGDKKYGVSDKSKKMLLLAYYLEFVHPFTKEIVKFELNLPNEYKEYFK